MEPAFPPSAGAWGLVARGTQPCPRGWEVTWALPSARCPAPGRPSAGGALVAHRAFTGRGARRETGVRGPRGGATVAGSRGPRELGLTAGPRPWRAPLCTSPPLRALGSLWEAALLPSEGGSGARGSPAPRQGPRDVPLPAARSCRCCGGGRWAPGLAGSPPTASLSFLSCPPPFTAPTPLKLPTPAVQWPRPHPRTGEMALPGDPVPRAPCLPSLLEGAATPHFPQDPLPPRPCPL